METKPEFVRFFNNKNTTFEDKIRLKHSITNEEIRDSNKHYIKIFPRYKKKKN